MTAEELVPCPAHLCGSDIGFCGLCGTAGAVTKAMSDDYLRMQRRTTVLEVPPMSDEDREELMQLARREAGALLVENYHVHPTPAGLKAEADCIARNLSANPIPGRGKLTRAILDLLRKVFP